MAFTKSRMVPRIFELFQASSAGPAFTLIDRLAGVRKEVVSLELVGAAIVCDSDVVFDERWFGIRSGYVEGGC